MSNPPLTLQALIQPVPVCLPTADLQSLLTIFYRSQTDVIVVVTQHQYPLGTIHCSQLVMQLASQESAISSFLNQASLYSTSRSTHHQINPPLSSVPSLSQFCLELSSLIRPIPVLQASLKLSQFSHQLSTGQLKLGYPPTCALINAQKQFLGLLAPELLLKAILHRESPQDSSVNPFRSHQLFDLSPSSSTVQGEFLFQLMEQLPFPLLLQTLQGQTIRQNSSWCQYIQDWIDLPDHKDAVLPLLTTLSSLNFRINEQDFGFKELGGITGWCNLPQGDSLSSSSPNFTEEFPEPSYASFSDQESDLDQIRGKTWQFFKLRLELNLGHLAQSPVDLILATEVTNQQRLYQELAAKNADLVQLNRLKDEFLACISHELKTPLTTVVGLSSLLKEKSLGELNQRQTRYAHLIYKSGRQLMTLVNDILDLTRLETGQLQLTLEPVQIKEVCDRSYQQALSQRREHPPIDFCVEIAPGVETLVADELRLRQMLSHLLSNAFKFTPDGGKVGLQVTSWEGWIDFTVWDTGIGIPTASQHLIFQKFQQLENPFTRQFEGTGLGLVLTQRLARAHGGDVSFISKVNEGSQFTLLLPPTPPHWKSKNQQDTSRISHPQLVLIVEAVPHYIENLTLQLRELGYRVVIARSGTEAVEKARQLQPQIIFLNPVLPLLSGWDVLTLLKGDKQTHHIPVIVTATSIEKQQAGSYGASACLSLPIENQALRQSLDHLQKKNHQRQQVLTILHLNAAENSIEGQQNHEEREFNQLLNNYANRLNYRILEASDLEQGELLAQFWKPNVILLNGTGAQPPEDYLRSLNEKVYLPQLPLITLEAKITEIANQMPNLAVFPCLVSLNQKHESAFLQVIQLAAGMSSPIDILVVGDWELSEPSSGEDSREFPLLLSSSATNLQESRGWEWVHALIQYLQTAGLKASLAASWVEVYRQIQYHSVDVILLYVEDFQHPASFVQGLEQLITLNMKPPIIVLDRRLSPSNPETEGHHFNRQLESLLETVATQILDGHSLSMADLLTSLHGIVTRQ